MTGQPPPPTQTILPGTPDEKLTLLIATLLDIILTILEALPIPNFLRRPLQNRARHECAALLTRLLATRVPAPATTPKQAHPKPTFYGPESPPHPKPAPDRAQRTARAPLPASEPAPPGQTTPEPETTKPRRPRGLDIDHPTRAQRRAIPDRSPAQNFKNLLAPKGKLTSISLRYQNEAGRKSETSSAAFRATPKPCRLCANWPTKTDH